MSSGAHWIGAVDGAAGPAAQKGQLAQRHCWQRLREQSSSHCAVATSELSFGSHSLRIGGATADFADQQAWLHCTEEAAPTLRLFADAQ